jgi:hypothetical protein
VAPVVQPSRLPPAILAAEVPQLQQQVGHQAQQDQHHQRRQPQRHVKEALNDQDRDQLPDHSRAPQLEQPPHVDAHPLRSEWLGLLPAQQSLIGVVVVQHGVMVSRFRARASAPTQ